MLNIICFVIGLGIPMLLFLFRRKWIAYYLIGTCFFTEFYYINVGGGKVRFYHLASIAVILALYKYWRQLFRKSQIWLLAVFVGFALFSALISDSRVGAVKSWLSLVLNVGIAVALLLLLQAEYITLIKLKQTVCYCVIVICAFGILQYFAVFFLRTNIGFSWEQQSQIAIGMIPAFRTEANVFGRSLLIMMFLLLPDLIMKREKISGLGIMYVLGVFCTMINMTRTVLYPAFVVLISLMIYYIKKGYGVNFGKTILSLVVLLAVIVGIVSLHILPVADYTVYKWKAFISPLKIDTGMLVEGSDEGVNVAEVEQGSVETFDDTIKDLYREQIKEEMANPPSTSMTNLPFTSTTDLPPASTTDSPPASATDSSSADTEAFIKENEENFASEQEYNVKQVESIYDVSASYRISNSIIVLKSMLESPKIFIFGRGWGQTYFMINNYATQAGAGDWGNVFAYVGIVGFVVYLCMTVNVLRITLREVLKDGSDVMTALGVLSGCIILGVAGFMSSNIIMPDFWMLIGIASFLEKKDAKA